MISTRPELGSLETPTERRAVAEEVQYEKWNHWPVNWTALWVGALSAFAAALIIGLIGIALGAHLLGPENRVVDLHKVGIGALIFSVCGAFFAFVLGGWVTGKIAGILRSEPAMLHGAIAWLITVPAIVLVASLGAGTFFGGWYSGLAGTPNWAASASNLPFERPDALSANATEQERAQFRQDLATYQQKVRQWREDTPKAARNGALGAVTALLLSLVGSVIGGWLASGEPMNFTHYRTRRSLSPNHG
jgi:hypothetical protein